MNTKNTTVITLAALTVIAGSATTALAKSRTGYVNVSGTVPRDGGGNEIKIELKNANDAVVGSSSYITAGGDKDGKIASKLDVRFEGAGLRAKTIRKKSDSTRVIMFYRSKTGGQNFNITVTNAEPSITVDAKATSGLSGGTSVDIGDIDIALGSAELMISAEGFLNPTDMITGVDFGDNIFTENFTILDDLTMSVSIFWDPDQVSPGSEPIFVEGFDLSDEENPFDTVALFVVDSFTFTPAPGPAVLAGLAGLAALRRNRRR